MAVVTSKLNLMIGINSLIFFYRNLAAAGGFLNTFAPPYPQTAPSSVSPSSPFSQFYSGFQSSNSKELSDKLRVVPSNS